MLLCDMAYSIKTMNWQWLCCINVGNVKKHYWGMCMRFSFNILYV